jgi:glutathione-specific gamma-glutamylcyclotransferase
MRLTPELVARVASPARELDPEPPPENRRPASDADYDAAVATILDGAPSRQDVWVFAYGSLIWKPAFDFIDQRVALAHGWHRAFCLGWDRWFRGTAQRPGLMMALDRGGRCTGVAYRLAMQDLETQLGVLVRREMHFIPHPFPARWISVRSDAGPLRAVTFAMDRSHVGYVTGQSTDAVADVLATAAGPMGSMAEYLYTTVAHLEALGIRDRHLWLLQDLVAQRLEAASASV